MHQDCCLLAASYVCQMPDETHYSCTAAFSFCDAAWARKARGNGRGRRRRPLVLPGVLFGSDLPRRIERAGIVDLGNLMVAEAEDLAQDFIGMLAKQGRAFHHCRTV
jgi:hypothetical protein